MNNIPSRADRSDTLLHGHDSVDATSEVLSHLSLSPQAVWSSLACSFPTTTSYRERQEVSLMLRPESSTSRLTRLASPSPIRGGPFKAHVTTVRALTIDSNGPLDAYEDELTVALETMGLEGVHDLREHQASAIAHALGNKHIFLSLATGAGKSLCFQLPAVIQAHYHQKVTVVIQPTLEIISSQLKALSGYNIDVEVIASIASNEEKNALAKRLYQEAYRPALIYTTADSFFGHYNYVFTTLFGKDALARIVLDKAHTILDWQNFRPLVVCFRTSV